MPDDQITPEEAIAALLSAGYSVVKPGAVVPVSWVTTAQNVIRIITLLCAMYAAQNVAMKPSPATPEQVAAVKDAVPTAEQVAAKVWSPSPK